MNHFMARLIFCFFAEDTDICSGQGLFTGTIEQMSSGDGSNNDEVFERIYIGRRFRNDTERLEKLFEMYTEMAGDRTVA